MSDPSTDPIQFITNDSNEIEFKTVENYKHEDKVGTKLTAQFRYGNKYGDETFFSTYWKPGEGAQIGQGSVNALVFICHGYCEYIGEAYEELGKQLSLQLGKGCLVFGHDHIGHGRTTVGDRALVNEMDEFVDPIIAHVEAVQKWSNCGEGNLPVFLVGHSMGGLISLFTLFKKQSLFQGFIGIGPLVMIDPDMATPSKKFLAKQMQSYFPKFSLPSFIDAIDIEQITRDKEVVEKIRKDKLRYHGGTKARLGWVLLQSCEIAQNNLSNLTLPLLVLQGEKDKLVVPAGAKMIHDNSSSTDKEYKEYPDAMHQLLVELEDVKSDAHTRILDWMNNRLNKN